MTRYRIKLMFFGIIAAAVLFAFGGCDNSYHIVVNTDEEAIDGGYIDILMPFDVTDENWRISTSMSEKIVGFTSSDAVKTEISKYDDDGFHSLCFHYNLYDYCSVDESVSDFGYDFGFSNEEEFIRMMEKYRKFRIAVFDKSGRIMKVSETYDARKAKNVYLARKIVYDWDSNTVQSECRYFPSSDFEMLDNLMEMLLLEMPAAAIILMIVILLSNKERKLRLSKKQTLIMLIPCIPYAGFLLLRIYYHFMDSAVAGRDRRFMEEYEGVLFAFPFFCFIPLIIGVGFLVYYLVRKGNEENNETAQAVVSDNSENLMHDEEKNSHNTDRGRNP